MKTGDNSLKEKNVILSLNNITKTYPGVTALDSVSIDFRNGEVHALLGENGAGKSTLVNVISGAILPDYGEIFFDGQKIKLMDPTQSNKLGIRVIYQELDLCPNLTAVENIFMGNYCKKGIVVDKKEMISRVKNLFEGLNTDVDINVPVRELSTAKQQLVEIVKAISQNVKLLIMDEPSSSLTNSEVELMFDIIKKLKKDGVSIIYITHRLEELFEISDCVSIFRDGRYIETKKTADTNRQELIKIMVGRELNETYPQEQKNIGDVVLEAKNLYGNGDSNISFQVKAGEILGFAGLVGSGRTEIAKVIFGVNSLESGEIFISGKKANIKSPDEAINLGIGLIPENRKEEGLILGMDITSNISLANLKNMQKHGIINKKAELSEAISFKDKLFIKTPTMKQTAKNLSGGNQQKVVLAKWLLTKSKILIFDEPTRGIDVGTKQEIYKLMCNLAAEGKAIVMISSDMEELLGMSDRLLVFYEGRITGELNRSEFNQDRIMEIASGS